MGSLALLCLVAHAMDYIYIYQCCVITSERRWNLSKPLLKTEQICWQNSHFRPQILALVQFRPQLLKRPVQSPNSGFRFAFVPHPTWPSTEA
jgi:hypothetical protein